MKNKLKYILLFLINVVVMSACRDDSKTPYPTTSAGAIPLFTLNDDDSGINPTDLSKTNLSFMLDKEGLGQVDNIDLTVIYNNVITGDADTAIYQTVSEFPFHVTINNDQLISAFPSTVLTADSLSIGDTFVFGGNVLLKDGTYLDGGYSPSIFTKKPVTLTYSVACPSNIPTGNYSAAQNDEAQWFGVTSTKTVSLTRVPKTANQYLISDVSAGAYTACCGAAYNANQPVIISDVCNAIFVAGGGSQIEAVQGDVSGSWDEASGTITVHYYDILNGGDGVDLVTVFVKQ